MNIETLRANTYDYARINKFLHDVFSQQAVIKGVQMIFKINCKNR
jgi:hypothetical protein